MIKKKRLKEIISNIEKLKREDPFKVDPGVLLNCFLLELGVRPKLIPQLTLYKVSKEWMNNILDCNNIALINSYYNDLSLINSLVKGVLSNYNSYKPKSKLYALTEKVLTTTISKFVECATMFVF